MPKVEQRKLSDWELAEKARLARKEAIRTKRNPKSPPGKKAIETAKTGWSALSIQGPRRSYPSDFSPNMDKQREEWQ